jgi:hypothetical protein
MFVIYDAMGMPMNSQKYLILFMMILISTNCAISIPDYGKIVLSNKYSLDQLNKYESARADLEEYSMNNPSPISAKNPASISVCLDYSLKFFQTLKNLEYQNNIDQFKEEARANSILFVRNWWWENGYIDRSKDNNFAVNQYDEEMPPSSWLIDAITLEQPSQGRISIN